MNQPTFDRLEAFLADQGKRFGFSPERMEALQAQAKAWEERFQHLPLVKALIDKLQRAWEFLCDPEVPNKAKAVVLAAVAYVVTPVDLIPDWLPVVGLLDDMVAMGIAMATIDLYRSSAESPAPDNQADPN